MVDAQLEEGMVICLEPETSGEVNGETVVVKVEDMYQVTATGLDQLTTPATHPTGKTKDSRGVWPSAPTRARLSGACGDDGDQHFPGACAEELLQPSCGPHLGAGYHDLLEHPVAPPI